MRVPGHTLFVCIPLLVVLTVTTESARAEELPALDCVINPHKVFDLGSSVRGVLDKVLVERSDYVEANQVVAELDAGVERASVAVAKARSEISSEMLLSEINLSFDTRRKERIDNLYQAQSVSIQNLEDAELEEALSTQRLKEAAEREEIRKLELWRAEELLDQKIVRSPVSGFVLKKFKSSGEYVEDQPIVRIAQLNTLNVEVIAPMDLFGQIEAGMQADVIPELPGSSAHRAEVVVVDRMGDVASGTFGVRLTLPNEDYQIPAGVKCRLQFVTPGSPVGTVLESHRVADQTSDARRETRKSGTRPGWALLPPQSRHGVVPSLVDLLIENLSPAAAVAGH